MGEAPLYATESGPLSAVHVSRPLLTVKMVPPPLQQHTGLACTAVARQDTARNAIAFLLGGCLYRADFSHNKLISYCQKWHAENGTLVCQAHAEACSVERRSTKMTTRIMHYHWYDHYVIIMGCAV